MGELLVGIDLGTTALKIAAFDTEGKMVGSSTQEYSLYTPYTNWVEAEPHIYFDAIEKGFNALKSKGIELMNIAAIGFSAQSETLFFVDEDGNPLRNAIIWMDNRAIEEAEILREKFGDELCYKKTGQVSFEPNWPAPKVLWVKRNEPEVFKKTKKVLSIEDFIIFKLSGRYVSDGAMLTSTEYWDITTKEYWPEMLETIGLTNDMLPEIMESGEVVGKVLPDVAQKLGINPEAYICTGGMDNAVGAIGVGAVREGIFSESIGSSLAVCVPTGSLKYDPNRIMPVHYYPIQDTYMIHTFTTGGMSLRWLRDNFCQLEMTCAELLDEDNYNLLTRQAERIPAGSDGLLFLPHLNGALAPDTNPNARGVFYGITLVHTKGHFIRAVMESLGYGVQRNIDALNDMGIEVDEVRAFGGGSKSPLWNQIKADILQKTICITNSKEAACLGAAILAGKAVGIFDSVQEACDNMIEIVDRYEPNKANAEVYQIGYENYKKLMNDLLDMFDHTAKQ